MHTSRPISKALVSHAAPVTPTPASTCEKASAQHQIGQSIFFKPFVSIKNNSSLFVTGEACD